MRKTSQVNITIFNLIFKLIIWELTKISRLSCFFVELWEDLISGVGPHLPSAVVLLLNWLAWISLLTLLLCLLTTIDSCCWYIAMVSSSGFACVGFRKLSALPKLKVLSELLQSKKLSVKWCFP